MTKEDGTRAGASWLPHTCGRMTPAILNYVAAALTFKAHTFHHQVTEERAEET